jgi:DNA gyrase inhibitor GyrI
MNLTTQPEIVTWPETYYVFIEKIGPFMQTAPACWQQLHTVVSQVRSHNEIVSFTSLYKFNPEMTYRAGVVLKAAPSQLPEGLRYEKFSGGKYSKFTLIGPYSDLPQASGRVFEMVKEQKIQMSENFCIENYVNDPVTTAPEKLITEILIPTV